jgi:hypothetical protein
MTKLSGNSSFSHGFPGHKTLGKPIEFQQKTVKKPSIRTQFPFRGSWSRAGWRCLHSGGLDQSERFSRRSFNAVATMFP